MTGQRATADAERVELAVRSADLLRPDGGPVEVRRLSGGHSHVTWAVRQGADPRTAYVVKVAQHDGPLAPYDVQAEADFMRLASQHGLPTPEVLHVGEADQLGAPYFVMRLVEGQAPVPRKVRDWLAAHPKVQAVDLAEEVLSTLAAMGRIHREGDTGPVSMAEHYRAFATEAITDVREQLANRAPVPETIELVHQRLLEGAEHLGNQRLNLVHGDFRFGNLMLDHEGRIAAILDWERGMWGHPLHDLAYLSLPSMGYQGRVAGLVSDEELRSAWKRVVGEDVDGRALAYLRTVSIFTELCSCVRALGAYMHGRGRTSLLRILPIIARHEVDVLDSLETWRVDGRPA